MSTTYIEVSKLLIRSARLNRCRVFQIKDFENKQSHVMKARLEVIRTLYSEGVSQEEICDFLKIDIVEINDACNGIEQIRTGSRLGKRCNACDIPKELSSFPRNKNTTDLCQPHCRECQRVVDKRYRERTARRPKGQKRHRTSLHIHEGLRELLEDTAARHKVTMSEIIERSLAKSMACVNCRRAVRALGGDDCLRCRQEWNAGIAS